MSQNPSPRRLLAIALAALAATGAGVGASAVAAADPRPAGSAPAAGAATSASPSGGPTRATTTRTVAQQRATARRSRARQSAAQKRATARRVAARRRACRGKRPSSTFTRRVQTLRSGTRKTTVQRCDGSVRTTIERRRTVTAAGPTRTVPGPSTFVPVPGPTQTVPGPTQTVPGPTQTVPGPPVEVPGPTVEVPATPKPFRLTLLHNNDGESKLRTGDSVADYGGIDRFATVVKDLRAAADAFTDPAIAAGAKGKGTLLVSSGDNFLPGLALTASIENGIPWFDSVGINLLGYDAITLGNHEFDLGQSRLADFLEGIDPGIPALAANLDFTGTDPRLVALAEAGRLTRSTVVTRGTDRIGVIGLTTDTIANISSPGNVGIRSDLADVVNEQVETLENLGVTKIVVSAHLQGIAADRALIPLVNGVDVWIAGGGDDLLADPDDTLIPGAAAVAPYPEVVTDRAGRSVQLVSTQGEFKYVGRLTMEFNAAGRVIAVEDDLSGPVRVSGRTSAPADPDAVAPDPAVKAQVVDPVETFRAGLSAVTIAGTSVNLVHTRAGQPANDPIRRRETNLGNLTADAFLWKARTVAPEADVALTNGGGIRLAAGLTAPTIDRGELFDMYPFDNQLAIVRDVPCLQLKELLEAGYRSLPGIAGNFAHIAGMRVVVDPTGTAQVVDTTTGVVTSAGTRVQRIVRENDPATTADDVVLVDGGTVEPGCAPLDVVTVDFLAGSRDGYPFAGKPFETLGAGYQTAVQEFLSAPESAGALGGAVPAARYPEMPPTTEAAGARIDILGE